jgi:hypothetical protein
LTNGELDDGLVMVLFKTTVAENDGRLGCLAAGSGGNLRPFLNPRITREPAMMSIAYCAVGVSDKDGRAGKRFSIRLDAR